MSKTTTKDGIEVKPGQVWRDLDKRMTNRHARVQEVKDDKAVMLQCTESGRVISERFMKIAIARMHKFSTGWSLVRDSNGNFVRAVETGAI